MGFRPWLLLLLLALPAFGQAPTRVVTTISGLSLTYPGVTQPHVQVQGFDTPGDWGPPKTFRWDSTNALATNAIRRATRNGVGRWVHDWDGDIAAFGAKSDGITDDGPALSAAFDYAVLNRITLRLRDGTNRVVLDNLPNNTACYLLVTNVDEANRRLRPAIVGNGKWRSRIQLEGAGTGIHLSGVSAGTYDGIGSIFLRGIRLEGFSIRGDGTNSQIGLYAKLVTFDGQFRDLLIENCGSEADKPAVVLDNCWNLQVDNFWWSPGGWGNFGVRNINANQQLWTKFFTQGAVGNSTNSYDMLIDNSEGSEFNVALGSQARWGMKVVQRAGAGGTVNKIFGQAEGPATPFWFGRQEAQTYASLTNLSDVAYLTVTNHGQAVGRYVTLSGVTPSTYNGTLYILSAPSTNLITLQLASDPGGPGSGGTWQPDAWAENWDLSAYTWSYEGSIHNSNTNIDRPVVEIERGRNIRIHNSSLGSLSYRRSTATSMDLRFISNSINGSAIWEPYIRAQFASHVFANGDIVSGVNLTNVQNYAVNHPGRATNVTATEVWWPIPGLQRGSDLTNALTGAMIVTAPAFPVKISPDSYNVQLKDNVWNNTPSQWTLWDEQAWPPATDVRIISWDNQVPNVIIATNLANQNTALTVAQASVNPWNLFYRNTFLQHRPLAVHLKCLFQLISTNEPATNEHVAFRLASLAQNRIAFGYTTTAVQAVRFRIADLTTNVPYSVTVRVPTDQYGHFTYQLINGSTNVLGSSNVFGKFELTQVGVEVE